MGRAKIVNGHAGGSAPRKRSSKDEAAAADPAQRARKHLSIETSPPANDDLERYVDRLENLEVERRAVCEQINELLTEADDKGHNKRSLKQVVKRRLETPEQAAKRIEDEESLDAMLARLGMLRDLPLGQAAEAAARAGSQ